MGTLRERGRTNQRTRARLFRDNPLCVGCLNEGRTRLWTQLDHIVALVNGGSNDDSNRQGLCDECHALKTANDLGQTHRKRHRIGPDGFPVEG